MLPTQPFPAILAVRKLGAALLASIALLAFSSPTQAVPFSVSLGPFSSDVDGFDFTLTFTDLPDILGDATLMLTLDGDFNNHSENAIIDIDGFSLGTILNGNPGDDAFDFASNDDPDPDPGALSVPLIGTAIISNADIAPLIVDSSLILFIDTSSSVDVGPTSVSATLSYETSVPEPMTLALLGFGLAGLGLISRRRVHE